MGREAVVAVTEGKLDFGPLGADFFTVSLTASEERGFLSKSSGVGCKNQVHRRVAKIAQKYFSSDPIGRRRLGQKQFPFNHKAGSL